MSYVKYIEDGNNQSFYDADGEYHYDDDCSSPARIMDDGREFYYYHGSLHRTDGPAMVFPEGDQDWYRFDQRHRIGGPAVISGWDINNQYKDGTDIHIEWHQFGRLHREPTEGPTFIQVANDENTVTFEWYQYGYRHRTDGPAHVVLHLTDFHSGLLAKLQTNQDLTNSDIDEFLDELGRSNAIESKWYQYGKLDRDEDMPAVILYNGTEMWYQEGDLHRGPDSDGIEQPAIIKNGGFEAYYRHGQRHRISGPALITELGDKFWYQYGLRHRTDGPAVEDADGNCKWYIDGEYQNRGNQPNFIWPNQSHEWFKTYNIDDLSDDADEYSGDESLEHPGTFHLRHRIGGPAVVALDAVKGKAHATEYYYNKGILHRTDGPAVVYADGHQEYYNGGVLERVDGPAVSGPGYTNSYCMNGVRVTPDNPELLLAENEVTVKRQKKMLAE
jgi:hypothetical protein